MNAGTLWLRAPGRDVSSAGKSAALPWIEGMFRVDRFACSGTTGIVMVLPRQVPCREAYQILCQANKRLATGCDCGKDGVIGHRRVSRDSTRSNADFPDRRDVS